MVEIISTEKGIAAAISETHGISFGEAVRVWVRIASLSFGGPAGQIAVMHRILVDEKRWIGESRFLHALNYCMLLPGPEAHQLAIYIGWLLHKTRGGLVAGILFVLPGFLSILALSYIYVIFGNVGVVEGLFFGLKAAVLAAVLQAVVGIGKRALKNKVTHCHCSLPCHFCFPRTVPADHSERCIHWILWWQGGIAIVSGGRWPWQLGPRACGSGFALGEETPAHARPNLLWS
jgi:chromate transporter